MYKQNIRKLLLILTMLFPLSTLLDKYIGFLNKILLVFVIGFLFVEIVRNSKINVKSFSFVVIALITFGISLSFTPYRAIMINPNMVIYYIFLVIYYVYIIDNKECLQADLESIKKIIYIIVTVYTVILTITIFLPISYVQLTEGGWGSAKYFASLSKSPNRVGPACLFIMVLLIYLLRFDKKRKILPLYIIPQLYAGMAGGSRTYFFLIVCTAFIFLYYWLKPKKMFWIAIIPAIALLIFFVVRSNIMTKINISLAYLGSGDSFQFWRRLTNSRNVIWTERIDAYRSFNALHKMFGMGVNYTSDVLGLWSHSDFIEILCSYGIIGLLIYIITMYRIYITLRDPEAPLIVKLFVIFIWLFNSVVNFFYCYFNAVLCYPILLMTLHDKNWKKKKKNNVKKRHRRIVFKIQ